MLMKKKTLVVLQTWQPSFTTPQLGSRNERNTINNFIKCLWLQFPVVVACANIFGNPESAKKIEESEKLFRRAAA